jgi:cytochrome c oxidase assembly factor CtaG
VITMYPAAPLIAFAAPIREGRYGGTAMAAAFAAFAFAQAAAHLPAAVRLTEDSAAHGALEAALLLVAVVYWSPVVAWPVARSPLAPILYLTAAMPAGDVLAIWLMSAPAPLYTGVPASDQHAAAAVMLTGSLVLGLAALALGFRAVRHEHRSTVARERSEPRHA